MKEYLLSVNKFDKPVELKNHNSNYLLLLRLMLLTPNTIQSHPNMGVGIAKLWRYSDEDRLIDLETEIYNQISTYLPHLTLSSVNLKVEEKLLIIEIKLDNELYVFEADKEKNTFILNELNNEFGGIIK